MTGHCFDSHQNPQNAGKMLLGNVPDKWDCLKYCRMFGLTGCYWKKVDGECVAHTKDVKFGSGIPGQFCYRFQPFGRIVQIFKSTLSHFHFLRL